MNPDDAVAPAAGEPEEAASSFGFMVTIAILLTLLVSTVGLQLRHRSEPDWARRARLAYHSIWPQGWAFFANYGDAPTLSVFRLGPDRTEGSPLIPRQMSSATRWGLSGVSLANTHEAQYIRELIPPGSWHSCLGTTMAGCLSDATPLRLFNRTNPASLCGSVAFVLAMPEIHAGMRPDVKVAVLTVECAP